MQVYGTTNIRVVDLSVVPLHVGSHTQGGSSHAVAGALALLITGQSPLL